jgi:transglutaminase-like putative cysteine protease
MIGDGNRTARVVVELGRSGGSAKGAASPGPEYLKASPALDSEDPKVKQLLERAMRGAPSKLTAAEKGERLRQFVHRFIKRKDLSVGMATASEVARTAQGDCTEHAVLLAALLRAAEIPSRTVAGLIYVDEFLGRSAVFGYHMWAEAWIGGRWVDLDATLDDVPFDAAHIALDMSAMNDPLMSNDLVKLSALIGRVRVHVVQTK